MHIAVVGLNHRTGSASLRSRIYQWWCGEQKTVLGEIPLIPLMTCNRVEFYFSADDPSQPQKLLLHWLRRVLPFAVEQNLYSFFGEDCLHHLFRVVSGLDSAVVGETEIQGQVKDAYEKHRTQTFLPPELHFLFQKALQAGKAARAFLPEERLKSTLEKEVLSLVTSINQPNILLVGASSVNAKIAQMLKNRHISATLTNHHDSRGQERASLWGVDYLPWEKRHAYFWDAVTVAVTSPTPVLYTPVGKIIIDLSQPSGCVANLPCTVSLEALQKKISAQHNIDSHTIEQIEDYIVEKASKMARRFGDRIKNRPC